MLISIIKWDDGMEWNGMEWKGTRRNGISNGLEIGRAGSITTQTVWYSVNEYDDDDVVWL